MMNILISDDYDAVSSNAFRIMKDTVSKKNAILGLATGSSPIGLYKKMIEDHLSAGTSYEHIRTWNLDEYVGIPREHSQSYWTFMHENLFNGIHIPEENIHVPVGNAENEEAQCAAYEGSLQNVTIDLQILGIGANGHIGFNEPGTSFDSLTHIVALTEQTRKDNCRFFEGDISLVPTHAITMGLATIMRAKKIVLIASGQNKAKAVWALCKGPVTADCPGSILQKHPDVTVIIDKEAAADL